MEQIPWCRLPLPSPPPQHHPSPVNPQLFECTNLRDMFLGKKDPNSPPPFTHQQLKDILARESEEIIAAAAAAPPTPDVSFILNQIDDPDRRNPGLVLDATKALLRNAPC